MGRKSKEAAGADGVVADTTAAAQLAQLSLTTTTSFKPSDAQNPFDLMDMCVAALQDSRGPTREQAMASLCGAFEALPPLDELDSRCLTIFALCGVSIKKAAAASANAKEARLSYQAVGLLALTLRSGSSDLLAHSFPLLSKTLRLQASHDDAPTLVAALGCLAAVTFAGAVNGEDVERSLKAIWAVIFTPASSQTTGRTIKQPVQVVVAAVAAWTFLVTISAITPSEVKTNRAAWTAAVVSLAGLLNHGDRDVRMAAGEALVVCIELNLAQYVPKKDMEAVVAMMRDLAIEAGGQGVSKTLLPEQRHFFRQVVAFVDHDERPTETVTVRAGRRNRVLKVSTWAKLVQLNFLRSFLGSGFLKHVQENELFKDVFSFGVEEKKRLSIANLGKLFRRNFTDISETSYLSVRKEMNKKNDKSMNVRRDLRWECKNVLCLESRNPDKVLQLGWH